MRKMRVVSVLSAIALAAVLVPAARADLAGPLTVTVWNGSNAGGVPFDATQTDPAINPTATFTYNGPIDFENNNARGGSNTFGDFFGSLKSGISGYTPGTGSPAPTLSDFLNLTMSTFPSGGTGETGPYINTYMEIEGQVTGGTPLFIQSDDGSCFYVGGSPIANLCHQSPQSENNPAYHDVVPGTGPQNFELVYAETNGSPADLIVKTPEPSMLFLLGTGLFGLAFFAYRRQTHGTTPTLSL